MITELSTAEQALQARTRDLADELLPLFREADAAGGFSEAWHKILNRLDSAGMLSMYLPPDDGGDGCSVMDLVLVQEQFGRHDGGFANIVSHEACASTMLQFAPSDVAAHYRKRMREGQLTAICITEPQAGTDLANMGARAVRTADGGYLLNGHKRIISLAGIAKILMFYALTDPDAGLRGGISVFVVDREQPGITVGETTDMLGYRLLPHADVMFEDVEVPASARLGEEGDGLQIFAEGLNLGRLGGGTQALGLAMGAYERALAFATERKTMGKPLIRHQAIGFKLAQMLIDIEAMRALTYATARWIDRTPDRGSPEVAMRVAIVKSHNSDLAARVTSEAVQVFGAQGIWSSNDVERLFRDAKVSQLVDGPNELMRLRIANTLARSTKVGS